MKVLALCMVAVMVATAAAEPPSGYNYPRPSGGYGGIGGIGGIGGGGGGGYISVGTGGYTSNEGQNVDSELLNKIRLILLREESNAASRGGTIGGISSTYGAPSTQYGVPSTQYGVPGYVSRVVGIDLEGIRQAIQVAQYEQTSYGSVGGYPSGPSTSYGAPSSSYGAPSY